MQPNARPIGKPKHKKNRNLNEQNQQRPQSSQTENNLAGIYITGVKNRMKGISIRNNNLRIKTLHGLNFQYMLPGHPKIFKFPKCPLEYFPRQIQHQLYRHFGQVIWLQPSIFSVPNPQFGQGTTPCNLIYSYNYLFYILEQFLPLCLSKPHLKHTCQPQSHVAIFEEQHKHDFSRLTYPKQSFLGHHFKFLSSSTLIFSLNLRYFE